MICFLLLLPACAPKLLPYKPKVINSIENSRREVYRFVATDLNNTITELEVTEEFIRTGTGPVSKGLLGAGKLNHTASKWIFFRDISAILLYEHRRGLYSTRLINSKGEITYVLRWTTKENAQLFADAVATLKAHAQQANSTTTH